MINSLRDFIGSKAFFSTVLNLILLAVGIIIWKILILGLPVFPERTAITVSGEGKTVAIPDVTAISFSVVTEGMDPAKIQAENAKKMNDAIEFVKSEGVDKRDIKTANYSLYPRYDYVQALPAIYPYPPGRQVLSGYTVTQTVYVKVRDAEKVSPILAALPEKGINQIESVSFEVDDPEKYLNEAREEAFKKARAKADAMASQNGVKVRRVVTFSESTGGYPIPYFRGLEAVGKGGDAGAVPPQIEPGSEEVTVQVSVTYEIR